MGTGGYDCVTIPGAVKNINIMTPVEERLCGRQFVTSTMAMMSTTICSKVSTTIGCICLSFFACGLYEPYGPHDQHVFMTLTDFLALITLTTLYTSLTNLLLYLFLPFLPLLNRFYLLVFANLIYFLLFQF